MGRVLVLGGYGNFGKRISAALSSKSIDIIIAGRNKPKAQTLADTLDSQADIAVFDVRKELAAQLAVIKPSIVINTCGPFQLSDYRIAETCIEHGVHYIDLADSRSFVSGISSLDVKARKANVTVVSGASTVPGLSSAVLDNFISDFSEIDLLKFGIAPGQQAERGLATTQAIMSYVGKPLPSFPGVNPAAYGWQDLYRQDYPELGKRWMANCDIPDLDLLPPRYGIKRIQFSAGLELSVMHLGLWMMSWLVRLGLPLNLPGLSRPLLKMSDWFNSLGSADSGMHMIISGKSRRNDASNTSNTSAAKPLTRKWFIIARRGHGPHIPAIPAILIAERLARGEAMRAGAYPCIGLVTLADYLAELNHYRLTSVGFGACFSRY